MKMKKILSGALASVMALSLAVPAFASSTTVTPPTPTEKVLAESSESSYQVELEGMIYTPTIRVQVTESGNVYVNPSNSTVAGTLTKALDGTTNAPYSFDGLTVVSTPILVRSDTDKALNVSAVATATVPKTSGVELVGAKPTTSVTDKQVYLYVTGSSDLGNSAEVLNTEINKTSCVASTINAANKLTTIGTDKKSASNAGGETVASIKAATQTVDSTTGKVTNVIPQYGVVLVAGDSATKCTTWTENDIVNVTVALTFALA